MARKSNSRSDGRTATMDRLKKSARDNMTTPNLLAAGAVALGAAAFAYLRDEQRRNGLVESARRGRDAMSHRWQQMGSGRHGSTGQSAAAS